MLDSISQNYVISSPPANFQSSKEVVAEVACYREHRPTSGMRRYLRAGIQHVNYLSWSLHPKIPSKTEGAGL
jgi:hypothetical protein